MSDFYVPKLEENLSPRQFLEVVNRTPDNLHGIEFVAPHEGARGYGYFKVKYRTPILRKVMLKNAKFHNN